jgi:hypothetical protein
VRALDMEYTTLLLKDGTQQQAPAWLCIVDEAGQPLLKSYITPQVSWWCDCDSDSDSDSSSSCAKGSGLMLWLVSCACSSFPVPQPYGPAPLTRIAWIREETERTRAEL